MAFNIQNITTYERSCQFSERRRSLFPQNNSVEFGEDSDLGCMSPLSNSSLEDSDELSNRSSNNIDDYDVIGIVRRELNVTPEVLAYKDEQCVVTTPNSKDTDQSLTSSLLKDIVSEPPIQKTPHDTLSVNSKLPKLSHKSVTDSCSSAPSKRKLSPYSSPEIPNKSSKVDFKNSKVRTTLFPEIDLFLPTKKFYSNCNSALQHHKIEFNNSKMDQIPKNKISVPCTSVHSRKKQSFKRNSIGTINAGVKHKIRRPKPKRNTLLPLARSTMNETQGNALRYYLENLRELKQTNDNNSQKMIVNNKENTTPEIASTSYSTMEQSMTYSSSNNPTENVICQSLCKEQEQFLNSKSTSENQQYSNNQFSHDQKNNNFQVPFNPFASNFSFTSQTCSKPSVNSEWSKKRHLSPANDEPDHNKKFFKFSRSHKGVVSMNESMKLMVDHGKVSLLDHGKVPLHDQGQVPMLNMSTPENFVLQQTLPNFEQEDFTVDEPIMSQVIMDNILSTLDNETVDDSNKSHATPVLPESQQSNQLIAQPSTSSLSLAEASRTPGSIVTASAAVENLILSPISQMCDVTSGLALNSPKRAKNLTSLMETLTRSSSKKELLSPKGSMLSKRKPLSLVARKFRKLHKDQMLLDAGQKKFGVTQCLECNFVYHLGDSNDEACHINYHDAVPILKFTGWKNERVIADFLKNGRIIQIKASDPKLWLKKVSNLMEVINRELGCSNMEFSVANSQIFLYIKNRMIAGCLVAIPTSTGYKMLSVKAHESDLCSERCFPVKCGIAQIWVSQNFRKQGIATALMNALKKNFFFGYALNNNEIAFSSPTEMGKEFARKYFGTPNFMIYFP